MGAPMKLVLAALLLMAGASVPVSAQQQPWAFVGFGDSSCGSWVDAREKQTSMFMEVWALGFISGANAFRGQDEKDAVRGTDVKGLYGWIDNYCRSQPLELFANAVNHLAMELKMRAVTK